MPQSDYTEGPVARAIEDKIHAADRRITGRGMASNRGKVA
jgi:hypothetical protein